MEWIGYNSQALTIILTAIGLALTITGGFFALLQWRQNIMLKRSEIIKQIVDKLRYEKDMADITYMVEYDRFKYTQEFHKDTQLEQRIDSLLALLDYACYLRTNNIIRKKEFSIIEYRVVRIVGRRDIQAYLWNLHHFAKANRTVCSFSHLVEYGLKNRLFLEGFENSTCELLIHKKFLNFR